MADIVFKVFFGDKAATRDQLDRLEDITVEQEQDVAWGASVKIPICTDEKGNWADADEKFFASFSRVRVEIKVGDGPFTPLIDRGRRSHAEWGAGEELHHTPRAGR